MIVFLFDRLLTAGSCIRSEPDQPDDRRHPATRSRSGLPLLPQASSGDGHLSVVRPTRLNANGVPRRDGRVDRCRRLVPGRVSAVCEYD